MNKSTFEQAKILQDRIESFNYSLRRAKEYHGKAFQLTSDATAATIRTIIRADLESQLGVLEKEMEEL